MSVDFARRYVAAMRANGITMIEHDGCYTRGNGQTSGYLGGIWHHTANAFDAGLDSLINGRPDLRGPLCNVAGHANGSGRLIAAHPANHAGASGGRNMGPLPTTGAFNRLVWGLEIMYPGNRPMTPAQYHFAVVHGAVVSQLLGRRNADWMRGHAETSITGKWDPGFAPGKTIDLDRLRADVVAYMTTVRPPQRRKAPEMLERTFVAGSQSGRINCPVGSVSVIVEKGWLSVGANGGCNFQAWFQKSAVSDGPPPGAGPPVNWTLKHAERKWVEIPSGTEYIQYEVSNAGGPGAVTIELKAK